MSLSSKSLRKVQKDIQKAYEKALKSASRARIKKAHQIPESAIDEIRRLLEEAVKESYATADIPPLRVDPPPAHVKADLAVPCFEIAKVVGESPNVVAESIAKGILIGSGTLIAEAHALGPFINIALARGALFQRAVLEVETQKDWFGTSNVHRGELAMVEYSSPNIAKPIGVGHLRSTIIGESLARLYEAVGYTVVRENWLGDWGTQFGKLLYAVQAWGDPKKIKKDPIRELKNLYVRFHEESEKDKELEEKARALFKKLEEGDESFAKQWVLYRALSLKEFAKIYGALNVSFDVVSGESFFTDKMEGIVADAVRKGIAKTDPETGALAALLPGFPSFLLKKKDGSSLYIARDLAALKYRIDTFSPSKILSVVGDEQSLSFRQLFALAEKLGYLSAKGGSASGGKKVDVRHITFGLLLIDGKKMATRHGTLIELEELMSEAVEKAKKIMQEKNAALRGRELEATARIIGTGAILYNDLRQSRTTNISFSWEKMLNFESGSAAYLQYTVVRIQSILEKMRAGKKSSKNPQFEYPIEFDLAKKLLFFPSTVSRAAAENAPHHIATYLEELAGLFNTFYQAVSVQKTEDENLKLSRFALIRSVAQVIINGLHLLNIKVPRKM